MKMSSIGGVCIFWFFSSIPAEALDEATDDLTSIFEYVCFDTLPYFEGAEARLRQMGFELTAFGDREFEGYHPSYGLTANLAAGKRKHANPSCTIQSENAIYDRAKPLAFEVFSDIFGGSISEWRYNGKAAGWKASLSNAMVYLDVIGEGTDVPSDVGISIEWRSQ